MSIHKQWVDCKSVRRTKSPYIIGIRTYRAIYNQNNELSHYSSVFRINAKIKSNNQKRFQFNPLQIERENVTRLDTMKNVFLYIVVYK